MRNKLGEYLRTIRMNVNKSLRQMADDLGISPAFLSAVENGKKKMPESWFELIPETYQLSHDEIEELKTAAYESMDVVEVNIASASATNKKLAIRFARRFEDLDEKTSEELLELLNSKLNGGTTDE